MKKRTINSLKTLGIGVAALVLFCLIGVGIDQLGNPYRLIFFLIIVIVLIFSVIKLNKRI